jgi:hypothetical protein
MSPDDQLAWHRERFSEAQRLDQARWRGRKVRRRHCIDTRTCDGTGHPIQRTLWATVDQATDDFLLESLRQRRARIHADVECLRADLDYINHLRATAGRPPIQMSFDFESDDPQDLAS